MDGNIPSNLQGLACSTSHNKLEIQTPGFATAELLSLNDELPVRFNSPASIVCAPVVQYRVLLSLDGRRRPGYYSGSGRNALLSLRLQRLLVWW